MQNKHTVKKKHKKNDFSDLARQPKVPSSKFETLQFGQSARLFTPPSTLLHSSPEGGAGRRGNKKLELPTSVSLLRFSGWKAMRVGNADSLYSVGVLCVFFFPFGQAGKREDWKNQGKRGPLRHSLASNAHYA